MKRKVSLVLLRIYDLLLAVVFIWTGVLMVRSTYGVFAEGFPKEFSDVLPFNSWLIPGVIFIIVFGVGNLAAFIVSLKKDNPYRLSMIMGCILFLLVVMQFMIIGEWYLASAQFIVLGIIQIALSLVSWRLS